MSMVSDVNTPVAKPLLLMGINCAFVQRSLAGCAMLVNPVKMHSKSAVVFRNVKKELLVDFFVIRGWNAISK
jgi:hypothetical protein